MSKKSVINRNLRRELMVERKSVQRKALKEKWLDLKNSPEEREQAFTELQQMKRDSSPVRLRIRCALTGRPRGVFRRFGISRSKLREMVLNGEVPGVLKSSW
ncbi:MAG: 30S ribosomal protein S14 [Proteobacteria bacterium]|nr:30S ribosomal protein S14 [Pseudomonadota bacterium]MCH9757773.1 30S ribosomal protein S14 [Pseudomonadota bacterium]